MDPELAEVLRFLNEHKIRATYGAVAQVLDVNPQSMGARLGPRTPEASWVVNADTGLPSGYTESEIHPDVATSTQIIRSGNELSQRMRQT